MNNKIKTVLNLLLTQDTGKFKFSAKLAPVICWLLVLPIAILSYVIVKMAILIVMFAIINIIPNMSPNSAYWFGFISGSVVGAVIGAFVFCIFGSAIAPKNNNTICLILGILLGLFFTLALFMGDLATAFVIPYLCIITGIVFANIYRRQTYREA